MRVRTTGSSLSTSALHERRRVRGQGRARGFTLVELVVGAFLTAFLAALILQSWRTFAVPARDVEARARIALSASLAAEALAHDLGGFQARTEEDLNRGQVHHYYKFVRRIASDETYPDPLVLLFQREDQDGSPDEIVVSYRLDSSAHTLLRTEARTISGQTERRQTAVATNLSGFQVNDLGTPPPAPSFQIEFSVAYPLPTSERPDLRKRFEANYTLNVMIPP